MIALRDHAAVDIPRSIRVYRLHGELHSGFQVEHRTLPLHRAFGSDSFR
jgi:hypothetical protein